MLEVKDFTKIYKLTQKQRKEMRTDEHNKVAANHISFQAKKGEIFGLLGPNGAGKTTTLRSIATLLVPTEGEIRVDGIDVVKEPDKIRSMIGFLTNEIKLDEHFTVEYMFEFFGRLRGMSKEQIEQRKEELFTYFQINEYKNKKIEELSTGMKQKLAIAVCIIHDPELIIFDEPTNGLDPSGIKWFRKFIRQQADLGKTVLLSSHILSEVQMVTDDVVLIHHGQIIEQGRLEEVLQDSDSLEDLFFDLTEEV